MPLACTSFFFSPLTKVLKFRFLFIVNALENQATKITIIFSRKRKLENKMTYSQLKISDLVLPSFISFEWEDFLVFNVLSKGRNSGDSEEMKQETKDKSTKRRK